MVKSNKIEGAIIVQPEIDGDPKEVIASCITPSVHLATFLATCGCPPQSVHKGPEVLSDGTPQTKWAFTSTPSTDEIMVMWSQPKETSRDWEHLSKEEKQIVINIVTAFCSNMRHFLRMAKEG